MDSYTTTDTPQNPLPDNPLPATLAEVLDGPMEMQLALMQKAADVIRLLAASIMDAEVRELAGARYSHEKPHGGRYVRHGHNPGSIRLGAERIPTAVPRVRDRHAGTERPLQTYQQMHDGADPSADVAEAVLLGLAQRDYDRVVRQTADGFGLSQSSISRRCVEEAARALTEFESRDLSGEPYVALWLDGKRLRGQQVVICVGATASGYKQVLGFTCASTEDRRSIQSLLRGLIERGLDFSGGLVVVTDGAKGLQSAVDATFGRYAVRQRCHWHKRENVVSRLPKAKQPLWRERLREAMNEPSLRRAETALRACADDLHALNDEAARSLLEGLDEVLTVHRLGVGPTLGGHLRTTNVIESVNARVETHLRKIKRYVSPEQRRQWVAMALLETERRFKRLHGYRHVPLLQQALSRHVDTLTDG